MTIPSQVFALASELNYNIGVMEFTNSLDDKTLQHAIRKIPPKTFLVVEDIDCLFDKRAGLQGGVSFSGLLNAFDGIFKNDGLIVFVTTNVLDKLDYALRRRVDRFVEFGFAAREQARAMFVRFFPAQADRFDAFWAEAKGGKVTPCVLQKFFARHLDDPDLMDHLDDFRQIAGQFGMDERPAMYT